MESISDELNKALQLHVVKFIHFLPKILMALIIISIFVFASRWVKNISYISLSKLRVDVTIVKFVSKVSGWLFIVVGFVLCFVVFGFNITGLATIVGGATVAIGLAFQGTLSNFASGMMLLFFRPFRVGDFVKVADEAGTVSELGIFATTLYSIDNRMLIIPNSLIFGQKIENVTKPSIRRVDIKVGISYSADINTTRSVLNSAMQDTLDILRDRDNQVVLLSLGDSAVQWEVRAWCLTENYWKVLQSLIQAIKEALDKNKIEIPYQKIDVNLIQ